MQILIRTTNYRGCPTHPENGSSAGVTSLGKLFLVAALTEYALLLKDKHGVLQLFVTTGADKVLRVPGATHGCGKGSSGGREGGREGGRKRGRERGREGSDYRRNKPLQHSIILVSVKHTLCASAFVFIISLSL